MRGSMKKRNKKTAKILAVVLAAALGVCVPETTLRAAETLTSVQIQMPGFVVEQFSAPRLMNVTKMLLFGRCRTITQQSLRP